MRCVNALATHPDFQRRGYGGALVDAVTSLADAEGRSTYLFSSNPINTEFYNSHGFFTLAELLVGEDEPTWKKPPVPIALVSIPMICLPWNSVLIVLSTDGPYSWGIVMSNNKLLSAISFGGSNVTKSYTVFNFVSLCVLYTSYALYTSEHDDRQNHDPFNILSASIHRSF